MRRQYRPATRRPCRGNVSGDQAGDGQDAARAGRATAATTREAGARRCRATGGRQRRTGVSRPEADGAAHGDLAVHRCDIARRAAACAGVVELDGCARALAIVRKGLPVASAHRIDVGRAAGGERDAVAGHGTGAALVRVVDVADEPSGARDPRRAAANGATRTARCAASAAAARPAANARSAPRAAGATAARATATRPAADARVAARAAAAGPAAAARDRTPARARAAATAERGAAGARAGPAAAARDRAPGRAAGARRGVSATATGTARRTASTRARRSRGAGAPAGTGGAERVRRIAATDDEQRQQDERGSPSDERACRSHAQLVTWPPKTGQSRQVRPRPSPGSRRKGVSTRCAAPFASRRS